jgi:drug/metabolite transporter (DMT)-like permease
VFCLGFAYAINMLALNIGERTIAASETTFLLNMSRFFTALFAVVFFNEKLSIKFVIGLIVGFLGVMAIALDCSIGLSFNFGVFYILIATITWSFF